MDVTKEEMDESYNLFVKPFEKSTTVYPHWNRIEERRCRILPIQSAPDYDSWNEETRAHYLFVEYENGVLRHGGSKHMEKPLCLPDKLAVVHKRFIEIMTGDEDWKS